MNTIQELIKREIQKHQHEIDKLNIAYKALLNGHAYSTATATPDPKPAPIKRPYVKSKLPNISWKKQLIPFLKNANEPMGVNEITKALFPNVRKKTMNKINARLSSTLWLLKNSGVVVAHGKKGVKNKPGMKYSISN